MDEENRETKKTGYVDAETQKENGCKKQSDKEISSMNAEMLVTKLKHTSADYRFAEFR